MRFSDERSLINAAADGNDRGNIRLISDVEEEVHREWFTEPWVDWAFRRFFPYHIDCAVPGCLVEAPIDQIEPRMTSSRRYADFYMFSGMSTEDMYEHDSRVGRVVNTTPIEFREQRTGNALLVVDGRPIKPVCQIHLEFLFEAERRFNSAAYLEDHPELEPEDLAAMIANRELWLPRVARVRPFGSIVDHYLRVYQARNYAQQRAQRGSIVEDLLGSNTNHQRTARLAS